MYGKHLAIKYNGTSYFLKDSEHDYLYLHEDREKIIKVAKNMLITENCPITQVDVFNDDYKVDFKLVLKENPFSKKREIIKIDDVAEGDSTFAD